MSNKELPEIAQPLESQFQLDQVNEMVSSMQESVVNNHTNSAVSLNIYASFQPQPIKPIQFLPQPRQQNTKKEPKLQTKQYQHRNYLPPYRSNKNSQNVMSSGYNAQNTTVRINPFFLKQFNINRQQQQQQAPQQPQLVNNPTNNTNYSYMTVSNTNQSMNHFLSNSNTSFKISNVVNHSINPNLLTNSSSIANNSVQNSMTSIYIDETIM